MRNIKKEPGQIFAEYEKGVTYNQAIGDDGLYEAVERYENFYAGRHWEGVDAPEMEKPVLNFTHRVVSYLISMLVSDDIAINLLPFRPTKRREAMCKVLAKELERVVERSRLKVEAREAVRSCAVDGDTGIYFYMDDRKTGEAARGEIACEVLENTKVIFGNPYNKRVQDQPYIILVRRRMLAEARELAEENGTPEDQLDCIRPDSEPDFGELSTGDEDLVTCLTKMWMEDGQLHWTEVCRGAVIRKEQNTGYRLYPFAWMPWESKRGSYHGTGAMASMIPNQIFVNKMWALMMLQTKKTAFPKILFNSNLINRWTNRVGEAIAVPGDVDKAIAQVVRGGDFSAQALEIVEKTITYTKDYMGANDVALGNVKPENTSAFIAVEKASSAPLEIQRLAYHQLMEDCARICGEIMRCDYGRRTVTLTAEEAEAIGAMMTAQGMEPSETVEVELDFSGMDLDVMEINVDVGTSSYWSEIAQQQSADALLKAGIIKDAEDYVERLPDKAIKDKEGLMQKLKQQRIEAEQQAQLQRQQIPGGGMPA